MIKKISSRIGSGIKKVLSSPLTKKIAVGAAVTAGAVGVGLAARKLLSGSRKKVRRTTTQKLASQIKIRTLKIKKIQLDRRLFKEQLKV